MSGTVRIELVANSGLWIECGGVRLLLDGLYGPRRCFTPPLIDPRAAGRYADADWVVFTHRHIDHYSSEFLKQYLLHNKIRHLLLPPLSAAAADDCEDRGSFGAPDGRFLIPADGYTVPLCDGAELSFHATEHIGSARYGGNVPHYSTVLHAFSQDYVFAADIDNRRETAGDFFGSLRSPAVFFTTPLFFAHSRGRELFASCAARLGVIYHLPFDGYDEAELRPMTADCIEKARAEGLNLTALSEPRQSLNFDAATGELIKGARR